MIKRRRYAILADIHSNWEALSAVLKDAESQEVTSFVCVGDVVGYNADPVRCLDALRERDCVTVRGNHDHYCASDDEDLDDFHPLAASVVDWTRKQLSADHSAYLAGLEYFKVLPEFTIVHSTLDMPEKWAYVVDSLEASAHFNYQSTALCFYGHTHVPMVFEKRERAQRSELKHLKVEVGRKYFVNVGSVGQPRDGDPRCAYAIYDCVQRSVELRRLPYDVAAAQEKVRKAGLPERLARRLAAGR